MDRIGWVGFAIAGAIFAAVVSVVAKKGMSDSDFLIGMTIQCAAALLTIATVATVMRRWSKLAETPKAAMAWMAGAGVAAGLSWMFGYRALKLSDVGRATPVDKLSLPLAVLLAAVFLKDKVSWSNWVGIGLMVVGAYFVAQKAK